MNDKIKLVAKQSIGYLIIAATSIVYILTAIFVLDPTGKSLWQIIGDGALFFFLGIFANRFFDLQGMLNGDRADNVIKTVKLHGEVVTRITPYLNYIDDWCEKENNNNYVIQRTKILAKAGLKYEDYFTKEGIAKPYQYSFVKEICTETPTNKAEKKYLRIKKKEIKRKNRANKKTEKFKVKCYWSAVKLKLTPLTSGILTSEGGKSDDPFNFGFTKKEYEKKSSVTDVLTKFCFAIFIGIYGVKLIDNFSWLNLLWTTLQVGLLLCMGFVKMYNAYLFVTNEFRGRIIKKIDNLEKFECYIKENRLDKIVVISEEGQENKNKEITVPTVEVVSVNMEGESDEC